MRKQRKQLAFAQFGATARRKGALFVCLALCTLVLGLSGSAQERKATFTTFDIPGALLGPFPVSINPAGAVVGSYYDENFVRHTFMRASDGTITTIDAPGAVGTTQPINNNPAGAIVGWYFDANGRQHSFLRAPNGTFTAFDVPDAGYGTTFPGGGINAAGVIAGIVW